MSKQKQTAADTIRLAASQFPDVEQGTACSQTSFKTGGKAFLFIGEQGGRHKAMFKLDKSIPEAERLADSNPNDIQVGKNKWVTARFTDEKPLPVRRWKKWLKESYQLCQ